MWMARTAAVVMALVLGVGATACSSDKDEKDSSATTTAPESRRTSDAKVRAGLVKLNATAVAITASAAVDEERAQSLTKDIEPTWQPIEGTIKANDADIYIAFEDNFAVLADAVSSSDAVQAKNAANTIKSTADDYLADYPG